ncbi:hypothetical protein KDK77_04095 [bacterium]|nr:hypothetical protein [bacterium]
MAENTIVIKKILPPEIADTIADFCESMVLIHTRNILSIAVYGSAVSQNYIHKRSNINIICIFKEIGFDTLSKSLKIIKHGRKKHIAAPLFVTLDYIKSSLDTFPIEFLEIISNHRTVYGKEILNTLQVPLENLRLQCEQHIKGFLVRLRQTYLENGTNKRLLVAIMRETFSNIFPIFRSLLRLSGEEIPPSHEDMVIKITSVFQFDGQVFLDIHRDRKGTDKILWKEINLIYKEYLHQLEALAEKIDRMKIEGHI